MQAADPIRPETPEHIAVIRERYLGEARGDAIAALDRALSDALADLCEAERRGLRRDRLISKGYVRDRAFDWEA